VTGLRREFVLLILVRLGWWLFMSGDLSCLLVAIRCGRPIPFRMAVTQFADGSSLLGFLQRDKGSRQCFQQNPEKMFRVIYSFLR